MKIAYIERRFSADRLRIIGQADDICREYAAAGYTLTLRQVYYQFVSRGLIPNRDTEYKRLGEILNDARMAGLIDWEHMEDRTRNVRTLAHWSSPRDILLASARSFRYDKWHRQPVYLEVWIEKDALVGVIEGVCQRNDVPFFSCRGYTSQSEVWAAAQRFVGPLQDGKGAAILHLGDHDPSGIDMTRDVLDRMNVFLDREVDRLTLSEMFSVDRLALTFDQVRTYAPPPNPAKTSDARFRSYQDRYGEESWELDALTPDVIAGEIEAAIHAYRDEAIWDEDVEAERAQRERLRAVADAWDGEEEE